MFVSLLVVAALSVIADGQPAGQPGEECCDTKLVGGISYTLTGQMDTQAYKCLNDCVYQKEGETGMRYCFAMGDEKVECQDEEGRPTPPAGGGEEGGPTPPAGGGEEGRPTPPAGGGPTQGPGGPTQGPGGVTQGQGGATQGQGGPCGPEGCNLTCTAGYTCLVHDGKCFIPCFIGSDCCSGWFCDDAGKKEGESCGFSSYDPYFDGKCEKNLICVFNPQLLCAPGICKKPEKNEGESCGSAGSGPCKQGLSCVHDSDIADAPGICKKKQEGESCGYCYCPPHYTAGECDKGLTCVRGPVADLPGTCKKKENETKTTTPRF